MNVPKTKIICSNPPLLTTKITIDTTRQRQLCPQADWILQFLCITKRSYRVFLEQRDIYPTMM